MYGQKMKVVFLNVEEGKAPEEMEVIDCIEVFYKLLGQNDLDICRRTLGGKSFRIVADDIGYYRENPKFSAFASIIGIMPLVGNLIVCGMEDEYGELTSLTDEDVQMIKAQVKQVDGRYVFFGCNA